MALPPVNPERISDLVERLLDRGYREAASAVIGAVARSTNTGLIARRLDELEAEARRLSEAGERLAPDNPVLRSLRADLADVLRRDAQALNEAAPQVQQTGVEAAGTLTRQLALPGFTDRDLALARIVWNTPDAEAVNRLVQYASSEAWARELRRFTTSALDVVNGAAIRGFVEGWGPLRIVREVRRLAEDFPPFQANNLMRTLQLQSYRAATAAHQQANAGILEYQIRIAARDERTCLCCIALHGTRLPVGEPIQDHHQGRCTSIAVVRGFPRTVQTGEVWFNGLPREQRLIIAGPGVLEALERGEVRLADFVQPYSDPVFGDMVREGSLRRALGLAA
jgi:hypothetical protein